jgi:hypothetical protein
MADVICLVDSDDDAPSPKRARRAPAGPSGVSLSPPRGGAPRGVERGSIDSQSSGGDLAVIATDATRAFTARASNLGRGRGRAAAAAADDDAWRRLGDVAEGRDDAADARERKRLDADRQRARRAAEKDAERARKAAERDEIRRRKAADAAADAARRAETRERDARERRARRDEASVATGRHKFKMLTVVLDAALAADAFGRALADALDGGVRDGGRGLTPLMHRAESLPLPWSVTWRYHPPSDAPVAAGDATARDATYTMLYLKAERFADMCVVDHEHEVALGRGGGGGGNGGDRTGGGGESPPAGGLRALLRDARATLPRGHALSLLVQGLEAHCVARERREHRARGIHGFSKKHVDVALARLYVGRGGRGLRVSTAQDMPHAVDAVVAVAVAVRPLPVRLRSRVDRRFLSRRSFARCEPHFLTRGNDMHQSHEHVTDTCFPSTYHSSRDGRSNGRRPRWTSWGARRPRSRRGSRSRPRRRAGPGARASASTASITVRAKRRRRTVRTERVRRVLSHTGPIYCITTASARRTPILKDFTSRRISPPRVPRFQSRHTSTPFNSASDAFQLHPDIIARTERTSSERREPEPGRRRAAGEVPG